LSRIDQSERLFFALALTTLGRTATLCVLAGWFDPLGRHRPTVRRASKGFADDAVTPH
jgi:hypothetical protein